MPVDLVGALVGWLVTLVGDAGIRFVRRSPDERALSKAVGLAINKVVKQADLSSQEALRQGLRECFSASPQLGLDASTSVAEGLRAAIAAQVAQLDQMVQNDTGQPFYEAVSVDRGWLIEQVTAAILTALRQVVAAGRLAELVHAMDAADVLSRLDTLVTQGSELWRQILVKSDHAGPSETAGRQGAVWAVPALRGDEVARPGLMEELLAAVTRPGVSAVGMTTGLWGAGGFGKTTMARLLVHRQEVNEQFPDGALWVTVGEDAVGSGLAEKVTNAVCLLGSDRPALTDPVGAGAELGRVLGNRRILLVVDDVWTVAQVEPFLIGGPGTARLFTSRIRGVLPESAELVRVDQMGQGEAEQLLTAGVSGVSSGVVAGLLAVAGHWPVLLALVNGAVRGDQRAGRGAEDSMREILQELCAAGPTALDIADANERHTAVARTIEVSLSRLTDQQRAHYMELGVFPQDVAIPIPVLARYFNANAERSEFETRRYCQRLAELALLSDYRSDAVWLHDVIHAYLREQIRHRRSELHQTLIDAHRSMVPDEDGISAWWQLPPEQAYLWTWLPTHLRDAGLDQELQGCLHHPGWLVGKLEHVGPAGLEADLTLSDDPLSRALGSAVRQNAHVLRPLDPPGSLGATLATRLARDGPTKATAERLVAGLITPHLRAINALPDLPHPALSRVLTGHTGWALALAVAPDGSWLASAGGGAEVRIWDPANGAVLHRLIHKVTGSSSWVGSLAVAWDGSWLASAGYDGEVRIWDPATGAVRHSLIGHTGSVMALVVAPDGSWLASAGSGGQVRIWDPVTGALRHTLTGHTHGARRTAGAFVRALVVAPDGSWLASAGEDGKVHIWDPVTGAVRHSVTGHTGSVEALVVAPDGSWLASAGSGGQVRIWDPVVGAVRHSLTGHTGSVEALVVAPDGSWLASAGHEGEVRIWDPIIGAVRHTLTGHTDPVVALVVAPDGSWLASADKYGYGGEVRIWDPPANTTSEMSTGHPGEVRALAAAPDGSWLASAGGGGEVRIWDLATGTVDHILTANTSWVMALAVAPDGSWLASAGHGGEVRIWDLATGTVRHILTANTRWVGQLAVAPDGSWLASAGSGGEVRIWDPATGTARYILTATNSFISHLSEVWALAIASDGSWLASAGSDGEVRIWDPVTGAIRRTLFGHRDTVWALAAAPDGSWLASAGGGGAVQIWGLASGVAHRNLIGHSQLVSALAVAKDGSWLASAGHDREIRIWDPARGTASHTLTGHTSEIAALAVGPDGSWLASADEGGEIRIWDPIIGTSLTSLRVTGRLSCLLPLASTEIVAAGKRGPFSLALHPGVEPLINTVIG